MYHESLNNLHINFMIISQIEKTLMEIILCTNKHDVQNFTNKFFLKEVLPNSFDETIIW
jgi:hypothetical protein